MTKLEWFAIGVNLLGCATQLALCTRWVRLARRNDQRVEALRVLSEKTIESLLPAVALCSVLADDERVPASWREMARKAIPKDVTIVKETIRANERVH